MKVTSKPITGQLAAIILAAGKGTRMKSDLAKVLHPLHGRAMIHYVVQAAHKLQADPIIVVIGHQKEEVRRELQDYSLHLALQEPQLGTGHAAMFAMPYLQNTHGSVLILSGDVPLIRTETLHNLLSNHINSSAVATVMTAHTASPQGYGRILRLPSGCIGAIIEERDADESTRRIGEINSGIYVFDLDSLRELLPRLKTDNNQKEFYLTDAVRLLVAAGKTVSAFEGSYQEVMGINTLAELQAAEKFAIDWELSC